MPVKFTQGDLTTASGLERVLRQFEEAIGRTAATVSPAPSKLPLPVTVSSSSGGGGGGGGGTPVIPLPELTLIDTHANRLAIYNPNNYNVGRQFFESDRMLLYVLELVGGSKVWQYVAGAYISTFANRPTDLMTTDTGALYVPSEHLHWCRWSGTAWTILDPDAGTFIDSAVALGAGWQVCDGSATTYLTISGAGLAQTAFTTPDEVTAPSGVYHKSISAYTGTINAPTSGAITGNVATNTTGITVTAHSVTQITSPAGTDNYAFTGAANANHSVVDPGHDHAEGTLAVATTGQPRNMGVLRYFRR